MGDKDDGLWLSLSLGCAQYQPSSKLSLMSSASSSLQHKNIWNELFQSSADGQLDTRSFLKGIDVNRAPAAGDCEEEGWVSSPNSTVSSVSGKKNERDHVGDETEAERNSCSRASDDEDGAIAAASRKKLRLSKEQSLVLEKTFKEHTTLNPQQKLALAKQLNLRPRQVEVWFQNRRARTKLKQTEVDCEYLKRCCQNLTHKNQRLRKEVQELRAVKLSPVPQLYNPPTTLTMCPSCQGVSVSSSAAAAPTSIAPNCRQMSPNHQHPVPLSPVVAMPITSPPFNAPASRS